MQHQQPTERAAAYDVLTSEELFRQIVAWSAGWPGLLIRPENELRATNKKRLTRVQATSKIQFRLTKVAIDVSRVRDARTLRIVSSARWYINGKVTRFQLTGIDNLIRSGDGEALSVVLQAMRSGESTSATNEFYFKYYYWSLAISHFTGTCDVLEALRMSTLPSLVGGEQALSVPRGDFIFEIQHADVARWFVETFGASVLPKTLVQVAGERGRRALFYYLLSVPGQDVALNGLVVGTERRHLLNVLVRCHGGDAQGCADEVLALALKLEDVELIRLILPGITPYCETVAVEKAKSLVETKVCYRVPWVMPPQDDVWQDPFDATKCEPAQKSTGFRSWLRTRVKKLGRVFLDRKDP